MNVNGIFIIYITQTFCILYYTGINHQQRLDITNEDLFRIFVGDTMCHHVLTPTDSYPSCYNPISLVIFFQ